MLLRTALLTATLSFASPAFAKVDEYVLDPVHSSVVMKVNHLGFSSYYLNATDITGEIEFDKAKPEKSSVSVVVKASSIDGQNQKLNQHLRTADFFDSEKFSDITFTSTGIQVTGERTALITGILSIRGIAQPVVLNTTFNKEGENPVTGDYRAGFSATCIIKRSDYGMKYALPALGDEVELMLEAEGIRQ